MTAKSEALRRIEAAAQTSPHKPRHWTAAEDEIILHGWGKVDRTVLVQIINDYQRANNLRVRSWHAVRCRVYAIREEPQ